MTTNEVEFPIELASLDDLPFILELIQTEYSYPYNTAAYWKWRYFENPVAKVRVYVIRREDGRQLAAMRPISAYKMMCKGEEKVAYLLTALITHPDYRRRGFFKRLVARAIGDLTSTTGELLIYTFPNELSSQGYRRFSEWKQREMLSLWVRPVLGRVWFAKRGQKAQSRDTILPLSPEQTGNLALKNISRFEMDTMPLLQKALGDNIYIGRDTAYLNWRYVDNPVATYDIEVAFKGEELAGYIVTKAGHFYGLDTLLIVDFVAENDEVAHRLLARVVRLARANDLQMIAYLVGNFNPYRQALWLTGFIPVPQLVLPRHFYFFTYPADTTGNPLATLAAQTPWYVTWGDNDIV